MMNDDDDEIWFIRHHYKVMTLLVSARKINNINIYICLRLELAAINLAIVDT